MQIIFYKDKTNILAWLTRIFTGCYVYHLGFYSGTTEYIYDMGMMRRRKKLSLLEYTQKRLDGKIINFPCTVTEEYLVDKLLNRNTNYSFLDYLLFVPRWLGFKVKDTKGMVCSEQVAQDLNQFEITPWRDKDAPPSPCDIYEWYRKGKPL